jgi:hypothetical protein
MMRDTTSTQSNGHPFRFWVACTLMVVTSCFVYGIVRADLTSSPTAKIYYIFLPYISRPEPPPPTATPTPTQTAVPTNTPTPTNAPTNTPTATATAIPSGAYILSNHSSYVDSIDYLHIVGEVHNNTANHLRFVKIAANVFDSNNQLLDTTFTYINLDNLPVGEKTCFHILLQKPTNWSYYQFEPPTYRTDGEPLPNLTVTNSNGSYDSTFGWYEIVGQIRNDHGSRVEFVSSVGTLYNGSSAVIGCSFTYVNSTDLDAGQTSSFKMLFTGRNLADVASYRLQTDGNPQ